MYEPKYTITNKMLRLVGTIEAGKEVTRIVNLAPAVEKKMADEARIDRIYSLVVNELPLLKRAQVKEMLEVYFGREGELEAVEVRKVVNIDNGFRFVEGLVDEKRENRFFGKEYLEIQALVSEKVVGVNEVGVYRKINIPRGMMAIEVPYQVEDLWLWVSRQKDEAHPLIVAGVVLREMRQILPFSYGNEIVLRLWIYYYLSVYGYTLRDLLIFSDWSLIGGDNMNSLIENFLEKIMIEAVRIKDKVRRVEMERKMLDRSGRQLPLSVRQILLMEEFQKEGEMRMVEMREVLPGISDDTILRELRDLEEKKMVKKKGKTKGARYIYAV